MGVDAAHATQCAALRSRGGPTGGSKAPRESGGTGAAAPAIARQMSPQGAETKDYKANLNF